MGASAEPADIPGGETLTGGNSWRAFALLALLLAAPLVALAPPAAAQQENVVIFFPDHDPLNTVVRAPPNVLQGEQLRIQINSGGADAWVRAKCRTGCLEEPDRAFYALWTGAGEIQFPRDFNAGGPNNDAQPIGAYQLPRYNGTWEITAFVGAPSTRLVNVWLMNLFTSPDAIAQPGATYLVHGRGYDANNITLRIDHKSPDGRFVAIHGPVGLTAPTGQLIYRWDVPKSEAARIRSCRENALDCNSYRLVVSGGGKQDDIAPFLMEPALIKPTRLAPTSTLPQQVERTMNLTAEYLFHYPGGTKFQGSAVTPGDIPTTSANPGGGIRIQVVNATLNESYVVDETLLQFVPGISKWVARWTVPKDLVLGPGDSSSYQLVLPETRDNWGNRIPRTILANYTVTRADLDPILTKLPVSLPRTEEGIVGLQIKYHNGTPWSATDNRTTLQGCFVPADRSTPCRDEERTTGEYSDNGTWLFKVRFPRTHEDLVDYRFRFPDETRDRWGNRVTSYDTAPFPVVAGSPRIEFRTVSQGLASESLVRGHRVAVTAVVTYGDGEPYNHTVAPNASKFLNATLIKRALTGEVVDEQTFVLTETDREAGRYFGTLDLTRDEATTPMGRWTFRFDVLDNATPANRNLTTFERNITGAPILLQPREQPVNVVPTGGTAKFRFTLRYEDGTDVPESSIAQRIEARVYSHNGTSIFGLPVSQRLVPNYEMGSWTIQYTIPDEMYQGRFAFVVSGADRFGNPIEARAISKSWTTFAEMRLRGALTQPTQEVSRGESAVVVFDGDAGDMGANAAGQPTVRLERYDPTRAAWVVELTNVRQSGFEGNDHVGVVEIGETTTIGTYRFILAGRDAQYRPIEAISNNFTVLATELTRAIAQPPPRQVVKGELFAFQVERRPGDQLSEATVLYNGRTAPLQAPVLTHLSSTSNVTWQVPFDAPSGNYTIVLKGFDVYGNRINIRSPAIDALPSQLEGSVLGSPPRFVQRGESVNILFGIQYPSGQLYLAPAPPEAIVYNASGLVDRANVARQGATFQVSWTPPPGVGFDEYWFEIAGKGASGNLFPTLRTESFRLSAGTFGRAVSAEVQPAYTRGDTVDFAVVVDAQDAFVGFELDYFGPVRGADAADDREALTTVSIPHDFDAATGRYIVQFPTDKATSVGAYRFRMTGEDKQGNQIEAASALFLLRTMPIQVKWAQVPQIEEFGEAKTLSFTFTLDYTDGTRMTDAEGRPNTAILWNGQPITDRPELRFENGLWHMSWTTPDTLRDGRYTLAVGGGDNNGNGIQSTQTGSYPFTTDLKESFSKTVPGPTVLWLLLATVGLALALARRQPPRR